MASKMTWSVSGERQPFNSTHPTHSGGRLELGTQTPPSVPGRPSISDLICKRRSSVFCRVARLPASTAAHISNWCAMKRAQIPSVKQPVGLLRQDGKRPDGTTIYHGRGESCWHGTSQSRTRMPTPTSATQPWKQELQPALPPPTKPTNTANSPQLTSSLQWPLKQPVPGSAPPASWAGSGTGKAGDHHHRRDHLPVPVVISGFAKGERGLISEHVHSRLSCCNQLGLFT